MKNKSLLLMSALSAVAISASANAQAPAGGFSGPSVAVMTVESANNMKDDTFVILQGNIKQNIGEEVYIFEDASGTINVEIDDEDWNGVTAGPDDLVEIKGEVDKGWNTVEIDVDQVSLVKK